MVISLAELGLSGLSVTKYCFFSFFLDRNNNNNDGGQYSLTINTMSNTKELIHNIYIKDKGYVPTKEENEGWPEAYISVVLNPQLHSFTNRASVIVTASGLEFWNEQLQDSNLRGK